MSNQTFSASDMLIIIGVVVLLQLLFIFLVYSFIYVTFECACDEACINAGMVRAGSDDCGLNDGIDMGIIKEFNELEVMSYG